MEVPGFIIKDNDLKTGKAVSGYYINIYGKRNNVSVRYFPAGFSDDIYQGVRGDHVGRLNVSFAAY